MDYSTPYGITVYGKVNLTPQLITKNINGSKDRNMKKTNHLFVNIVVCILFSSCAPNPQKEENKSSGIYASNLYDIDIQYAEGDSTLAEYRINRLFNELGEDGFVINPDYDFYIISVYQYFSTPKKIQVIKRLNGITTIVYREIKSTLNYEVVNSIEAKAIYDTEQSVFNSLVTSLDSLTKEIKEYYSPGYFETPTQVYYFNGKNYYYFSFETLEYKNFVQLKQIVSTIKNSNHFQQLKASDSTFDISDFEQAYDHMLELEKKKIGNRR